MNIRRALAGLIVVGCAGGALASPKMKGGASPKLKVATTVNLENKRPKPLLTFELVAPGAGKKTDTIVGKLDRPLAAGESVSVPLTGAKGCVFEARWKFEDLNDFGTVNLCSGAHIVLVE